MFMNNTSLIKQNQQQNSSETINGLIPGKSATIFPLTASEESRSTSYKKYINKKWKTDCLAGDLLDGCVIVSQKELANAANCSTQTVYRDMRKLVLNSVIFRFQGLTKGKRIECERLKCWVGERRYFYGFVCTVKESTTVLKLSTLEINRVIPKEVNYLKKEDRRVAKAKRSGKYDDEQLKETRYRWMYRFAVKEGLAKELAEDLGISKAYLYSYIEEWVKEMRRKGHYLINQKAAIRGYIKCCKESGLEKRSQFKRNLEKYEAMANYAA